MSESHTTAEVMHNHADDGHAEHPHINYMLIFYALCVLTVLSVLADVLGGDKSKVMVGLIVLTVATFKAMFVMLYFMHIKFEGKWKYALLAPTMILALALIVALAPDIGSEYYMRSTPQAIAHPRHSDDAPIPAAHPPKHP